MVRVIEGKIIEKWSERKQKLLRVREGKITVTVWQGNPEEIDLTVKAQCSS